MEILRDEKDLTPEMVSKIREWVKNLTWQDFEQAKYGCNHTKKEIWQKKGVATVQSITDILHFKHAAAEPVIMVGELFLVDSIYSKGKLCIAKLSKSRKKGHTVLYEIAKKSDYYNYCNGYFAIPFLK